MSGVSGYEDACGKRERLECPYSTCDGCPLKPDAGRLPDVPMVRVVDGFPNRDEMRGMIGGLRESIAPDVEFHEVPRLEDE